MIFEESCVGKNTVYPVTLTVLVVTAWINDTSQLGDVLFGSMIIYTI